MHSTFFDYSDLDQLCADRDLVTCEIHATNDFYGQASVLKRFAEIEEDYSLKFVVEHGINLDDKMWDHDRDSPLPFIYSPSKWRADHHRRLSGKRTRAIGFGYLYAKQLLEQEAGAARDRRGTIAFPCHSTHTILAKFDHEDYARRLADLPEFMQPITVCMYWKNYLLKEHLPYQDQGLRIVSAGHMFDRDFLLRLHDLSRQHLFSTSNEMGSHLFLTVSSGCRFVFTGSQPIEWDVPKSELKHCGLGNPLFEQHKRQATQLFGEKLEKPADLETTQEQLAFVDRFIGTDCMLTGSGLRKRISQAEMSHRLQRFKSWTIRRCRKLGKIKNSVAKRLPWRKVA